MFMCRAVMMMFRCVTGVELLLGCVSFMVGMYTSVVVGVRSLSGFLAAGSKKE